MGLLHNTLPAYKSEYCFRLTCRDDKQQSALLCCGGLLGLFEVGTWPVVSAVDCGLDCLGGLVMGFSLLKLELVILAEGSK